MPKIKPVQELAFDGTHLFCPDHPQYRPFKTSHSGGKIQLVCLVPNAGGKPCMHAAEWPSEAAMREDLAALAVQEDAQAHDFPPAETGSGLLSRLAPSPVRVKAQATPGLRECAAALGAVKRRRPVHAMSAKKE